MNVTYSREVASKMKDGRTIKRCYGALSSSIETCISVLMVADTLADVPDVPPTRRHKLSGKTNCWALKLSRNWRMIIRALEGTEPENISSIEIISVEDYH